MTEQAKASVGVSVRVGVGVGAKLEVILIQLPSVRSHWHLQSSGEQSRSTSQLEPWVSHDSGLRPSSWKREQPRDVLLRRNPPTQNVTAIGLAALCTLCQADWCDNSSSIL